MPSQPRVVRSEGRREKLDLVTFGSKNSFDPNEGKLCIMHCMMQFESPHHDFPLFQSIRRSQNERSSNTFWPSHQHHRETFLISSLEENFEISSENDTAKLQPRWHLRELFYCRSKVAGSKSIDESVLSSYFAERGHLWLSKTAKSHEGVGHVGIYGATRPTASLYENNIRSIDHMYLRVAPRKRATSTMPKAVSCRE